MSQGYARIALSVVIVLILFRLLTTRGTGWPRGRSLAAPGRWG